MQVTNDGNWFSVEPATAPAASVGAAMLATRMERVLAALPEAAEHANQDVEHVHQLRVGCRRTAATLHAFESLAGKRAKKLDQWLKKIRRAAGPARDADVLAERFRREHHGQAFADCVLERIADERATAQDGLHKVHAEAGEGKLARAAQRCEDALSKAADEEDAQSFACFGREALTRALDPVAGFHVDEATNAELHGLRIAAKRLRYSLELFQDALHAGLAREVYGDVEEVQERLGELNDRASAQARWQKWLADAPADGFAGLLGSLVAGEWRTAEQIRGDFLEWWTETRRSELVGKLRDALDSPL